MNTGGRSGKDRKSMGREETIFRMAPMARAIALTLAAGAVTAPAYAQRAFSPQWFNVKGATQNTVAQTGLLPNGAPASSLTSPLAQQQQANAQLQRSISNLNLAAQAIAAQQAAQAAARQAALDNPSSVPDGLADGGLKVDTNSLTAGWLNAGAPVQSQAGGRTTVTVQQTADKAILNWETFNVGKNTTVQFQQQTDWALLNRVNDPQARPSQIQGKIKSDGTVLIVNRNGIVFSGSSQVDTRNLVAAAANIDDTQFRTSGLYGPNQAPSFTDAWGKVEVQAGAQITTNQPTSVTQGGGYVLLMGTEVSNAGEITTHKGQAELAAGDSFVLRKGLDTDVNTASTTRGNEVSPQFNADSVAGKVTNTGLLLAREGDVTLAGRDVQQNGVAVATTTVNQRGTIHLLNSASDMLGTVTLGKDGMTAVVLEDDGKTTALDSQRDALIKDSATQDAIRAQAVVGAFDNLALLPDRRDLSRIEIVSGGDVNFQPDSLTLATGGQIAVSAKNRTTVADAAQLDVSGAVGVNLTMASNEFQVNIQGNEQRDAPLNRDTGNLLNANVWIDRRNLIYVPAGTDGYDSDRYYTAGGLLEVGGYLGNQGHGIGEWSAQGGTVTLGSSEVVTQAGSAINLSGGSLNVQTGYVDQTWLKGSDGQLYNANSAPADIVYTGVYKGFEDTHERWGPATTEYYYNPLIGTQRLLENGYTAGRDAGQLIVSAPTAVVDGDIVADVFNGARQTGARPATVTDSYKLGQDTVALPGALILGAPQLIGPLRTVDAEVVFGDGAAPEVATGTVWFDAAALNRFGLGGIAVTTTGSIEVAAPLSVAPGGAISLAGTTVQANADITARSGSIFLGESDAVLFGLQVLKIGDTAGTATVASGVTLDTRGLWTNLLTDPDSVAGLAFVDGGNVTLQAAGDVTLTKGALIDASSGGAVLADGSTSGGVGGDIALIAGYAYNGINRGGNLIFDGEVRSYGVTRGGILSLQSGGAVVVGDPDFSPDSTLDAGEPAPFNITLASALTIAAGTPLPIGYNYSIQSFPAGTKLSADTGIASGTMVQVDWTIPSNIPLGYLLYQAPDAPFSSYGYPGAVVPAGSRILNAILGAGYTLPVDVFPDGVLLASPIRATYAAGTVLPNDVVYAAGTILPAGTVLDQSANIQAISALKLTADLFSTGFSNYTISGETGLVIASGAQIAPEMPLLRFNAASLAAPTGTDPANVFDLYVPSVYTEDPARGTLTQRAPVNLNFLSGVNAAAPGAAVGGSIDMEAGAKITVDPGATVNLASGGQIVVNGSIIAPGGVIDIVNNRPLGGTGGPSGTDPDTLSILVGNSADLDVSARAYTVLDNQGQIHGVVPNGGSIVLGGDGGLFGAQSTDAFIVIRPGALLQASGASETIDLAGGPAGTSLQPGLVASNGGSISLHSNSGIYADGLLEAFSGGGGASGGTLDIALESPVYSISSNQTVPANLLAGRVLTISEDSPAGSTDPSLVVGTARLGARQVEAGGFDTLSLLGRTAIAFDGDVTLNAGRSITLLKGAIYDTVAAGNVTLNAPYVLLSGQTSINGSISGPALPAILPDFPTDGTFSVNADLIDIQNVVLPKFADTRLTSRGDLRFLSSTEQTLPPITTFAASGNVDLTAQQLYPTTGANVFVYAGVTSFYPNTFGPLTIDPASVLTTASIDGSVPAAPYSVFGQIVVAAGTVRQGGVLRAPLGSIILGGSGVDLLPSSLVELLPGSLTSVSADGLVIPYGGTVDGVKYTVDGGAPIIPDLINGQIGSTGKQGVSLAGVTVAVDAGSRLDLSGGGTLAGAAFVSGRGGSVDTLLNPLVKGGQVYAILPGIDVAPTAGGYNTAWTGVVPGIGQQIVIPAGVPGLPAGTYTLLPANYALLPGAYRVELDGRSQTASTEVLASPNGTFVLNGFQRIADTSIADALPTSVRVTPGATFRTYSQYDEQGYDAFQLAQVATFGAIRPLLPRDGKTLTILLNALPTGSASTEAPALTFEGSTNFASANGGYSGSLVLSGVENQLVDPGGGGSTALPDALLITAPGSTALRSDSVTPVAATTLDAVGAPNLYIGGAPTLSLGSSTVFYSNSQFTSIDVEAGARLTGSQIAFAKLDSLGAGAEITTLGQGSRAPDSSLGYLFGAALIVSNGQILTPPPGDGSLTTEIGSGASIYADGTIAFGGGGVVFDGTPHIGARSLELAVNTINIGGEPALAAAAAKGILSTGLSLDQNFLDQLLSGGSGSGAPAVENLVLAANSAVNFYGSVDLNTIDPSTGKSRLKQFVLYSPAIYGYGNASDVVNLTTGTLVWSVAQSQVFDPTLGSYVILSTTPGAVIPGGAGTGTGTFNIDASQIILGYTDQGQPNTTLNFDRLVLGFSAVNLNASESISSSAKGTLSVFASGPDPSTGYDAATYAGNGGTLNLNTPLLTAAPGSSIRYRTGGALTIKTPAGIAPATNTPSALGAEIDLAADSIDVSTAIVLPSGKLTMTAANDIVLDAGSRIDLSGQAVPFYDVTKYTWGGDVELESTHGSITQAAGSAIDLSAAHNDGGTLKLTAADAVLLNGSLSGNGADAEGYDGGVIDIRAQRIGQDPAKLSADFSTLNSTLNAAGFSGSRSFDLRQGSLAIAAGEIVKARNVAISIDDGSLTIDGTIDASGAKPGAIALAARGDLTLGASGVLDAHGTSLQADSYGQAVDAENQAAVDLTTTTGTLTLTSGATIDVSSPDINPQGKITLNAPRAGAASGSSATGEGAPANAIAIDIAISATGPLNIVGAKTIVLDGTAAYLNAPADPNDANGQIITQGWLDLVDQDSQVFINGALANTGLQGRLAGLATYGSAFHLRPDVEIDSATPNGNLTVSGDINLAGYRYGPGADRDPDSPTYGAGEPGDLVIRAGGNFSINGSITDGFGLPPAPGTVVLAVGTLDADTVLPTNVTLAIGTHLGVGSVLPFDVSFGSPQRLLSGVQVTSDMTLTATSDPLGIGINVIAFGGVDPSTFETSDPILVVSGQVDDPNWNGISFGAGDVIPGILGDHAVIHAGTILKALNPADINSLNLIAGGARVAANRALPRSVVLAFASTLASSVVVTGNPIVSGGVTYSVGTTIPAGTTLATGAVIGAGNALPFDAPIQATTWAAGTPFDIVGGYTLTSSLTYQAGSVLTAGTTIVNNIYGSVGHGTTWAVAPMLAPGSQSWSMRLVSGAALGAADTRTLQAQSLLAGSGNMVLDDAHYDPRLGDSIFSVIRTGTGDLDLLAGGQFAENSLYGIYTAGTQTVLPGGEAANAPFELPPAPSQDGSGTALGQFLPTYEPLVNQDTYYPDHGGDLLVSAQGDLGGKVIIAGGLTSDGVANWLNRQGGDGVAASWSINFGTYVFDPNSSQVHLAGFTGFGALGGGNVTMRIGGNAGEILPQGYDENFNPTSSGLVVAVGSTGRVTSVDTSVDTSGGVVSGGTLVETGGGNLSIKIGGNLNPGALPSSPAQPKDLDGVFTNLRGALSIDAGAIGSLSLHYGPGSAADPRFVDPNTAASFDNYFGAPVVMPGDSAVSFQTRGDLLLGGTGDPGQVPQLGNDPTSWFTLWRPASSISLFSAGGNVDPAVATAGGVNDNWGFGSGPAFTVPQFTAIAASGNLYMGTRSTIELIPSPIGQLELLAQGSIYAGPAGTRFLMSGANSDPNSLPNPFRPATLTNVDLSSAGQAFFVFESDNATGDLHAGDPEPIRVYANTGDIVNLSLGKQGIDQAGRGVDNIAAKSIQVEAGRDIVNFGNATDNGQPGPSVPSEISNLNSDDVSTISAGRDIFYANVLVAGSGTLDVTAGRNLYQGSSGSLTSIGPIATGDTRPGAGIVLQAGVGASGPNYAAIAALYLNPANLADATLPLADQPGKVVKTYDDELVTWLKVRYGYTGTAADALTYFNALASEQQAIFLRQVYYAELKAGGREYNDPDSRRYLSYLRGRDMIATLFPDEDAQGHAIVRQGDITMFGGSGVQTQFGGDIEVLAPGGQVVVGVQGEVPPASSGLLTQGEGDISIYSQGSVLLGLSRIMTTFGGSILAWSAEGDINAGRGSKTTLVYTPPKRVYDDYGNVKLSPNVPSSGAGIATLAPIAEVPAGDVDLIAPLGTIDAGEAGIRVSGNVNLAALQVVNAANIQVQGKSTGIPVVAAVNVGALTNASAVASQAAVAAQDVLQRERSAARQALPSIFTVRVLGFGNERPEGGGADVVSPPPRSQSSLSVPYDTANPVQFVGVDGDFDSRQLARLTTEQRRQLQQDR